MSLDRKLAPDSRIPEAFNVPEVDTFELDNHTPVHYYATDKEDIVKIDFLFDSSTFYQYKAGAGNFVARLLKDGTSTKDSLTMNQLLERYGVFFEASAGRQYFTVTAYILNRVTKNVLPLFAEILEDAVFPLSEIDRLRSQLLSQLKIDLKKTSFAAGRSFKSKIFGDESPYGQNISTEDIESVQREDVLEYYNQIIKGKKCIILITGKVDHTLVYELNRCIGKKELQVPGEDRYPGHSYTSGEFFEDWDDAVQSSLRMGHMMPNRLHPDIHRISIANEIFGGYFGSRLMKNIREEKGYTYGIYSRLTHLKHASYLTISAEVMKDTRALALEEVKKEMRKLISEPVPKLELETVKNYMIGAYYSNLSSPFSVTEHYKILLSSSLEYEYYSDRFNAIRNATSESLMEIYERYFNPDNSLILMVG